MRPVMDNVNQGGINVILILTPGRYNAACVDPSDVVECGQLLAEVVDIFDAEVRERLVAPVTGRIFFMRGAPLINQYSIAFKIALLR